VDRQIRAEFEILLPREQMQPPLKG
jgi:hypothetical protein